MFSMKFRNLFPVVILGSAFTLMGCSDHVRVKSDYDRDIKFDNYKTFNWLANKDIEDKNNPLYYNELTDKRIKKAVELQFETKKIKLLEYHPDFKIHYHIIVENRSAVRPSDYDFYSPYWLRNQMDVYPYREGTLIIDLMDATNNNLLWRGWATSFLDAYDREIDLPEAVIDKVVAKILKEFPPKQKK